jgi:ParB family transcriptional regulator, chromosome partitioning protein
VSKERRLGRGLEALLGQLPPHREKASPAPAAPIAPVATETVSNAASPDAQPDAPAPQNATPTPSQSAPAAPSAEAMFRLDVPHGAPSPFFTQSRHAAVGASHVAHGADVAEPPQHNFQSDAQEKEPLEKREPHDKHEPQNRQEKTPGKVSVRLIDSNPAQPRQDFDQAELKMLAESLSSHGLLQPLVVRKAGERYQLVAGERRLRAAILAGWADVPVHVVEADDRQMAELAIVENLQRKDLNALEKAASFQKYIQEYNCTQEELAARLKLDRSTIANLIRLLELPAGVQEAIRRGKITQGHARALLPLGDEREQVEFCNRIQRENLNVRQTEAMVQEIIDRADREPLAAVAAPEKNARKSRAKNDNLAALEQEFRRAFGLKVQIAHNARGRGKLVVFFRNNEEFEDLKKQICGK